MNRFKKALLLAGMAAALSVGSVQAQGFDPAEMQQRQMDAYKEQFAVTDDAEWKIISERLTKVIAAQRDVQAARGGRGGFGGFGGGGRGGGRRGDDAGGPPGGGERRRGGGGAFGAEPPAELTDLRAALEAKAPAEEIKAKLEKLRAYRKNKDAELTKAQGSLKEVLNARQEATAVMAGLLN